MKYLVSTFLEELITRNFLTNYALKVFILTFFLSVTSYGTHVSFSFSGCKASIHLKSFFSLDDIKAFQELKFFKYRLLASEIMENFLLLLCLAEQKKTYLSYISRKVENLFVTAGGLTKIFYIIYVIPWRNCSNKWSLR